MSAQKTGDYAMAGRRAHALSTTGPQPADWHWTACDNPSFRKSREAHVMQHLTGLTTGCTIDKGSFDAKDSLDMTDADRAAIRAEVERQAHRHILITHGTDSMVDTARALAGIPGKTIVLTGALNPARFQGSDAVFNIGCAVGAVQTLGDGVWIAMNGRVWDPAHVRKNRAANRFEGAT